MSESGHLRCPKMGLNRGLKGLQAGVTRGLLDGAWGRPRAVSYMAPIRRVGGSQTILQMCPLEGAGRRQRAVAIHPLGGTWAVRRVV